MISSNEAKSSTKFDPDQSGPQASPALPKRGTPTPVGGSHKKVEDFFPPTNQDKTGELQKSNRLTESSGIVMHLIAPSITLETEIHRPLLCKCQPHRSLWTANHSLPHQLRRC
ncbi:hypothetical protein OIU85_027786 [Salix viminalis]|uniref:Uncharacterized protein n=1 Tax=Salix viminalis TaxID=40686 RepID=A0A9Q0TBE9_SALVM|nr:hypothetical protein OIU85_027786 [Salix viminalis]